jgi:hypothetical protein
MSNGTYDNLKILLYSAGMNEDDVIAQTPLRRIARPNGSKVGLNDYDCQVTESRRTPWLYLHTFICRVTPCA